MLFRSEKETLEHKELNFKTPELQKIRVRKIPSQRFFCFDLSRIIPADLCYDERKESDVIGDICGIISGAIGSGIIYRLAANLSFTNLAIISALFTALISSFTIAGKAIGKMIAMESSRDIVLFMSKFIQFFQERLKINILGKKA